MNTRPETDISYQLHLRIHAPIRLRIGALGEHRLPAGEYVYTGSARRHLEARIARHLRKDKPLRWHIDYLTTHPDVEIVAVRRSALLECIWHQGLHGQVVVPGFGASDCKAGCGTHLVLVEPRDDRGIEP